MATVSEKLVTAGEFLTMTGPPNCKLELVRGRIVTVCRPGFRHGFVQLRIGALLDRYGHKKKRGRAVVETGVITELTPDTVRGPDVSYWSAARLPLDLNPSGYPEEPPDLCVGVLSPSNIRSRIDAKMKEYFARGVKMVWVADPKSRTLTVHRSLVEESVLEESDTVTVSDVLPGFKCRVHEFFE